MVSMTGDMTEDAQRPYFMWDEEVTIAEVKRVLAEGSAWERDRLLAKMLREARDVDVWHFVTPEQVAEALPRIAHRLGRRRGFWEFLIHGWRDEGLIGV